VVFVKSLVNLILEKNMKKTISILLTFLVVMASYSQEPKTFLRGKIQDTNQNILPGANVIIDGTQYGVISNESGEYRLGQIVPGKLNLKVSFVGYKTILIDLDVLQGENYYDFTLQSDEIQLDVVTVSSQKREQQILDVPITMSVIDQKFIEENNVNSLDKLSEFVPGLLIRMQGTDRPSFVIRGLTSDEISSAAQPRISVFYNNVPISRANGAAVALFDMQQVDVLKGPQGTLFGRGAEIGAINYVSKKPSSVFNGFITAGIGNFKQKEISGALNLPIVKNKLNIRIAGIYDYQDGYITNTFGGNLNGKNTVAGRFSASYLPAANTKIDLVLNYQKDDNPGLGFMSMAYPNTGSSTDPYLYVVSNEQNTNLVNQRDLFDATLNLTHFINVNSYLTSISSYRRIDTYSRWDGDGTAASAIDMSEDGEAGQFFQEIRYNYSIKNKITGSSGVSFWSEKAGQNYWFSPNEQDMYHLFFNTGALVTADGQPNSVTNLPLDPMLGPLAGLPLNINHQEENNSNSTNQALEAFGDANFQLTGKLALTVGFRAIKEWIVLSNSAKMSGGDPATLGFLTGNYPNLFFKPSEETEISSSNLAVTYRGGFKYSFYEKTTIFANYSRGRRPEILQFTSAGEEQIIDAEIVNSYDLGFKTAFSNGLWFDLGLFYYGYSNFQTSAWVADAASGEFDYLVIDGGKASGYGAEMSVKYAVLKNLQLFGNYAFIHARFAEHDIDGNEQAYANNMFRLTPEHSFSVGLNGRVKVAKEVFLFGSPSYSYKTRIFFEDANTPGLEQGAYGLLNFNGGVERKNVSLSFWVSNLTAVKYIVSAGNTGSLFGAPTQIPGAPGMFGTKINWKF